VNFELGSETYVIPVAIVFQIVVLCVVVVVMLGFASSAPQQQTTPIPILRSAQETDLAGGYSFR
jgi:hypothetical protein